MTLFHRNHPLLNYFYPISVYSPLVVRLFIVKFFSLLDFLFQNIHNIIQFTKSSGLQAVSECHNENILLFPEGIKFKDQLKKRWSIFFAIPYLSCSTSYSGLIKKKAIENSLRNLSVC